MYCVGLSAGNRFFSAIAKQGSKLAIMSAVIVGVSALFTCLFGIWFKVPAGISSGIFAGACTSTPALAAATESLPGASGSGVSIGYGIAYPFGVVGVVLFVQLLPRLLHFDLNKEAKAMHSRQEVSIISRLVRVTQPNLIGQNIADCKLLDGLHCMVTRVVRNDRLMPLTPEDTFREGTEILIVGNSDTMPHDIAFLGEVCDNPYPMDSQKERRKLILTNKNYAGHKLRDLKTLRTDGIIISRISRLGFTFVPTGETTLERNDVLTVVGTPENLTKYGDKIGHRSQDMNQTDLLSLGFGLSLGTHSLAWSTSASATARESPWVLREAPSSSPCCSATSDGWAPSSATSRAPRAFFCRTWGWSSSWLTPASRAERTWWIR